MSTALSAHASRFHRFAAGLGLLGWLLVPSPAAYAGDLNCAGESGASRAGCVSVKGGIIGLGALVVGATEVLNALTPGTAVLVKAPGAEPVSGTLTRKGASGRQVKAGDTLELTCTTYANPYPYPYGFADCRLEFPRVTPNPRSPDYYAREGRQPAWNFGANREGEVDPSILKLSQPVRLSPAPPMDASRAQ